MKDRMQDKIINDKIIKYVSQLALLLMAYGVGGYIFFKMALPEYYFTLYPCVAAFFFIIGVVIIVSLVKATPKNSGKYFNTFMLVRGGKLLSIIIVAGLYAMLVGENTVSFLFVFFAGYLIYSIFETFISMKLNKDRNEFA